MRGVIAHDAMDHGNPRIVTRPPVREANQKALARPGVPAFAVRARAGVGLDGRRPNPAQCWS